MSPLWTWLTRVVSCHKLYLYEVYIKYKIIELKLSWSVHTHNWLIVVTFDVHCQKDIWLNSFSVIHGKPVSQKLQEIVYFGPSSNCSLRKKSKKNFLWICTCTQYVFINYRVSRNSVEQVKGIALTSLPDPQGGGRDVRPT